MEFTARITEIGKVTTGTTKSGSDYASIDFEATELNPHNADYPQVGMFSYFKNGEYAKYAADFKSNFSVGDEVTVEFNLKRVDYKDKKTGEDKRFYKTECWKVQKIGEGDNNSSNENPEDVDVPF